jgi:hypothetical protein
MITEQPGTGLLLMSASPSYSVVSSGVQYGVPGDSCYDTYLASTSGPYVTRLNQRAVNDY